MTIDQIRAALKDRNLKEVERQTGIPYVTLSRIRNGHALNSRYETVRVLVEYLKQQVS